jgi:hypothetical protein
MRVSIGVFFLSFGASFAKPTPQSVSEELSGPCKKVTFIYARASTETNNMVSSMLQLLEQTENPIIGPYDECRPTDLPGSQILV